MADSPLAKALKRRDDLLKEIGEIDQFIALYNRFSETKEEQQKPHEETLESSSKTIPAPKRKRKKASPADIARVSADVIRAAGRPLTRSDLVKGLEERGLTLDSKDKPRYVGTILWRLRDQFENLEGHGYWLKGEPYAPANYPDQPQNAPLPPVVASREPVRIEPAVPARIEPTAPTALSISDLLARRNIIKSQE